MAGKTHGKSRGTSQGLGLGAIEHQRIGVTCLPVVERLLFYTAVMSKGISPPAM